MDRDKQRRGDLESHVQETLVLLKEYEDQLRLSDDPRQKRKVEREIVRIFQLFDYLSQQVPRHKPQHPLFKGEIELNTALTVTV